MNASNTNTSEVDARPSSKGMRWEGGEAYLEIQDYDQIPAFFCSLTSDADLWLFVSSSGSLTAGRGDPDHAMLPYETVDRIHDNGSSTGPFAIFRWRDEHEWRYWEPLRFGNKDRVKRRLLKNVLGSRIVFEEVLEDEALVFRSTLMISDQFGLVRQCEVISLSDSPRSVELIHGVRNLIPTGVTQRLQNEMSCLTDAYKQSEISSGFGIYSMASALTDQPVPHESLRATVAWSRGLVDSVHTVDANAITDFLQGDSISPKAVSRGVRGNFIEFASLNLLPGEQKSWIWVGDTNLDQARIARLISRISNPDITTVVLKDIAAGENNLRKRLAAADAQQNTKDSTATAHHLANVLFNLMRGGIFGTGYAIPGSDFASFVSSSNKELAREHSEFLTGLPLTIERQALEEEIEKLNSRQMERIFKEYLPLSFSRRHGDPSRPWNRFRIQTRDANGNEILSFQGNWRDIFQNWEALALSFPDYLEHIVSKFVNASTADGYNPYRLTREGIDWEEPDPEDPWASYGYWGDHQIIYLLKLLESLNAHQPGRLRQLLCLERFTYANVPYRIFDYENILKDPRNTMTCDMELAKKLRENAARVGSDAKLLGGLDGDPSLVTLLEKLLVPTLVKWSNFVPGGGIWMNTQRPEWNDANNALVGNGLSMVTLYYLRRSQQFLHRLFVDSSEEKYQISKPVVLLLNKILGVLVEFDPETAAGDPAQRKQIVDALGRAGSSYREAVYSGDFTGEKLELDSVTVRSLLEKLTQWADATIHSNRRTDGLFHAYNLIRFNGESVELRYLEPMLEGQVAVLSSGILDAYSTIQLLDALQNSPLYCERRRSYILYPDKEVTPFMTKNRLLAARATEVCPLLGRMVSEGDTRIVVAESKEIWRFNPELFNEGELRECLRKMVGESHESELSDEISSQILTLYEEVFNHHAFTGRSGSMFAYEGLGSIYWHMVSKLLLAVQENLYFAVKKNEPEKLILSLENHYNKIRDGIGYRKSAVEYGAFPTDPYSHTPAHAGAQQPGMTGQVKEEVITRRGELGVWVEDGCLVFNAIHQSIQNELTTEPDQFEFINIQGGRESIPMGKGCIAYTVCQTPVVCAVRNNTNSSIRVHMNNGDSIEVQGNRLNSLLSRSIFSRDGMIHHLEVEIAVSLS